MATKILDFESYCENCNEPLYMHNDGNEDYLGQIYRCPSVGSYFKDNINYITWNYPFELGKYGQFGDDCVCNNCNIRFSSHYFSGNIGNRPTYFYCKHSINSGRAGSEGYYTFNDVMYLPHKRDKKYDKLEWFVKRHNNSNITRPVDGSTPQWKLFRDHGLNVNECVCRIPRELCNFHK